MATTRRGEETTRRGRSPPATIKKEIINGSRERSTSISPTSASRSSSGKADTKASGTITRKPVLRISPENTNNCKRTTANTQGGVTMMERNLTRNRSMDKPPASPSSSAQGTRLGQTTVKKDRTLLKSSTFSPSKSVGGVPEKSTGKITQRVMSSTPRIRSGGSTTAVKKGGSSGVTKPKEGSTRTISTDMEVIVHVAEEEEIVIGEAEQDLLETTQLEYQILEELPDPERNDDENLPKSEELEQREKTQQIPCNEELDDVEAEKSRIEEANIDEQTVKDVEAEAAPLINNIQGKKEAMAYNDVIEETANKLVEKRRGKVLALVGAFETVISLQEPETPNRLSRPPTPQGVNKPLPVASGNDNNQPNKATTANVLAIVHDGANTVECKLRATESQLEDLEVKAAVAAHTGTV